MADTPRGAGRGWSGKDSDGHSDRAFGPQYRAIRRRLAEEAIKRQNIEDIARKALPSLGANARPEDVENDWIANFFDKCRLISDEEMQELRPRVLAGEANAPGQFSKRTVNLLASFDKADAESFRSLCSFVWSLDGSLTPLVLDHRAQIYTRVGVHFTTLLHLASIGVISFDADEDLTYKSTIQSLPATYQGKPFMIDSATADNNVLGVDGVLLTKAGTELATVGGAAESEGFEDYVVERWKAQNLATRRL